MTFRTLLVIKAIVCVLFGPILLFVPGLLFKLLGASLGAGGSFTAREYGAALFGTMVLTWFARNVAEARARHAILLDLFVYDAIGFVVTLLSVVLGVLNPLGWGIAVVYLFFTLGSGYLLLTHQPEAGVAA
jgi:hypothetical protein